jgi:diguanylate cyclase (GGDEF)-like protein
VSKPSDFSPSEALEVRAGAKPQSAEDGVWRLRILGFVLLVMGWIALSVPHFGSSQWLVETIVLAALGAYAFVAAAKTRKTAVSLEKKLRLDLLVHNVELENMAMRDDLTQLFNRRYFFERLERELQAAKGFSRPLSVMIIDLDDLKLVNDTCGHKVGDEALTNFGAVLLDETRASDVPARIGGDEFAIILPDTDERSARILISRLVAAIERADLIEDNNVTLKLGASLGLAGYPWSGQTVDEIMQAADASMYSDKHSHKNSDLATHATRA